MRRALLAIPALLCTLTLSLPARADDFDAVEKVMDSLTARIFSEQNVGLLFDLLRQNLAATGEGRQAPDLTPEATASIEATGKEVQREMSAAAVLLLGGIEKEMRDTAREFGRP